MNFKSLFALVTLSVGSTIAFSAPAQAASFSFKAKDVIDAGCVGQVSCNVNSFFTLTADGGTIHNKTSPMTGIGVNDGNPNRISGEIEVGEALSVDFAKKGVLKSLHLNLLYPTDFHANGTPIKQAYGDRVFEVAIVTDKSGTHTGKLTVTEEDEAIWSFAGAGGVLNHSKSVVGKGGWYEILNPFAGEKIKGFTLKPEDHALISGKGDSDFSLYAATVDVPEPATLLGLGVVGLFAAATRRRSAKVS